MTYNLRGANLDTGIHAWQKRRPVITSIITTYKPLLMATQEGIDYQVDQLAEGLGYTPLRSSLVLNGTNHEYMHNGVCLFYDPDNIKVLDAFHFWLSETPNTPSVSWDSAYMRMALFAKMQTTIYDGHGNFEFFVVATHLDHKSRSARDNGAKLIADTLNYVNPDNLPVFLMGDFNTAPGHSPYNVFIDEKFVDVWDVCHVDEACTIPYNVTATFHFWLGKVINTLLGRWIQFAVYTWHGGSFPFWDRYHIDWILYKNLPETIMQPKLVVIPVEPSNFRRPHASDHYPVVAVFERGKK